MINDLENIFLNASGINLATPVLDNSAAPPPTMMAGAIDSPAPPPSTGLNDGIPTSAFTPPAITPSVAPVSATIPSAAPVASSPSKVFIIGAVLAAIGLVAGLVLHHSEKAAA